MIFKKRLLSGILSGFMLSSIFYSCSSDDNADSNINFFRPVRFLNESDKEISAKPTGNKGVDENGVPRNEYEVIIRRSNEFSTADLMKEATIEKAILYPGSLLRGESFINGNYEPLILTNSFNPVTLYLTINGVNVSIKKDALPKENEVSQTLTELKTGNSGYFPDNYIPTNYTYDSEVVTTDESFKKIINLHVKSNFSSLVNSSFDYDYDNSAVKSSSYVLVKLRQTVYSAGIDLANWTNWVEGNIKASEIGLYEPVYISNIDYGRVAYLLIETNKSAKDAGKMVKGAVDYKIGKLTSGENYLKNEELKKLFNTKKINVSVLGGPSNRVTSYDEFINYMNLYGKEAIVSSSAPISYTIRRLKDNTKVEIVNTYEEVRKELR
ncbi:MULTISPECIES: thiol-activated cytolysin family protein [Apibacter]|uniref:thiol-activated cytolysin family protein n=1 Tax=Apibacter TaxID=1778601 RepID=UPI001407B8E5|nr:MULTISPECIES: thiol-activated cytolysin family protein [Apibacter]QII73021.1 hypothetical protein G8C43_09700 [Apibacter sp. B2966]